MEETGGFQDVVNNICTKKSDSLRKECKTCSSALVNPITAKPDYQREKMKDRTSQKWDITDCVSPELLQSVWKIKRFSSSWQQEEFICNLSLLNLVPPTRRTKLSCHYLLKNKPALLLVLSQKKKMQRHGGMSGERILTLEQKAAEYLSLDSAPVPDVWTRAFTSSRGHEGIKTTKLYRVWENKNKNQPPLKIS